MNERLKEFVKQAGTDSSGKWMGLDHAEKFAELIAGECARISEADAVGDDPACCTNTSFRIANKIKRHFGVEG